MKDYITIAKNIATLLEKFKTLKAAAEDLDSIANESIASELRILKFNINQAEKSCVETLLAYEER